MKMLRIMLSVLLVLSLVIGATSCKVDDSSSSGSATPQSSTAESATQSGSESTPETESHFPLVTEPTTLSVFTNNDDNVDLSNNWFTQHYEKLTGVTVDWQTTNSDQYLEKLNLLLAGGDEMDIITTKNKRLEKVLVYKYGLQGVILPINKYFENNESYYYNNILQKNEEWKNNVTAPDGNIYGFNDVGSCYHCFHPFKMWVNQKWMDNLSIKPPTTPEEFKDMLRKFRDEDANGNGDLTDEVPLTTCTVKTGSSSNLEGYLMNAFQYSDYSGNLMYVENGIAKVSYNTDNWRDGLRYLNELYSEGLIDSEAYIQDRTTMRNRNESGEDRIFGAVPAQHIGVFTTTSSTESWKEYVALPPLTGPNGLCTTTNGTMRKYDMFRTMIAGTSDNPELAFRFCDGLYEKEENGLMGGYGEENVAWRWAEDGEMGKDGLQARYTQLIVGALPEGHEYANNYRWGSMFAMHPNNHSKWTSGQAISDPLDTYYERALYINTEPYAAVKYDLENTIPSFFFSEDDNSEVARLQTTLLSYTDEMTASFVSGIKDIETDWDAYLKGLEDLGLSEYLEIYQRYLDEYNA